MQSLAKNSAWVPVFGTTKIAAGGYGLVGANNIRPGLGSSNVGANNIRPRIRIVTGLGLS